jgi:DNA-directed RNA polymerase I, II, and III subunit RPABC2
MFEEKDEVESVESLKKEEESDKDDETMKDSDVEDLDDDEEDEEDGDGDGDEYDDDGSEGEILQKFGATATAASAFVDPDDDDDDDEEDDAEYLQKFDESIRQQIVTDFHPELKTHNYDEIEVLSRVVRDNNGTIIDPLHKTFPFITKYERARVLGERATQLNAGAKPFIELEPDVIDGYVIALKEFEQKKIPFIVKRPLPNGAIEYWKLEDLEIL